MQILNIFPRETMPIIHRLPSKRIEESLVGLQNNMLNYALKLTRNRDKAKDLRQETTLKVLCNLDKYSNNTNFKGWVLTIMHNIFVNNYRQALRQKTILDYSGNLYLLNLSPNLELNNPESDYSYSEITKAIHSLDCIYKTPFTMLLAGYSYFEIAEFMKLPLGTIKSRLSSTRKQLQTILVDCL